MNVSNLFIFSSNQIQYGTALKLLADTTLSGANATIDSGTFSSTGYAYIQIILVSKGNSNAGADPSIMLNHDGNNNYAYRYAKNDDADVVSGATGTAYLFNNLGTDGFLFTLQTQNIDTPKSITTIGSDSGNNRYSGSIYWNGSAITRVEANISAGTFNAGSRLIVLGM